MSNEEIIVALARNAGAERAIVPNPDAEERAAKHYFGGCPICGETDGYINNGPDHWFVCDEHQTKWCIGSNLFSDWRDATDEERLKYAALLREYREVEPIRANGNV